MRAPSSNYGLRALASAKLRVLSASAMRSGSENLTQRRKGAKIGWEELPEIRVGRISLSTLPETVESKLKSALLSSHLRPNLPKERRA